MTRSILLRVLAVTAWLISIPAAAADGSQPNAREACKPDFKQFCSTVQPGGGRGLQCLKEHVDQLSPDCKTAVLAAKDRAPDAAPKQ